mmetsp:Transcript_19563/g.54550  ORF Transcript_19563/g.54550 Transcript_19563/m.54550 type:complete len:94 (-) Transcript_19563:672-953(-)
MHDFMLLLCVCVCVCVHVCVHVCVRIGTVHGGALSGSSAGKLMRCKQGSSKLKHLPLSFQKIANFSGRRPSVKLPDCSPAYQKQNKIMMSVCM